MCLRRLAKHARSWTTLDSIGYRFYNLRDSEETDSDDSEFRFSKDDEPLGISSMHGLRSLQLFGNNFTNKGLTAILDNCTHLESLDIRHCFNVIMDDTLRAKCARIKKLRLPYDSTDDYQFPVVSPMTINSHMNSIQALSRWEFFGFIKKKWITHVRLKSLRFTKKAFLEKVRMICQSSMENFVLVLGSATCAPTPAWPTYQTTGQPAFFAHKETSSGPHNTRFLPWSTPVNQRVTTCSSSPRAPIGRLRTAAASQGSSVLSPLLYPSSTWLASLRDSAKT